MKKKKLLAIALAATGLFGAGLVQAAGADLSVKGALRNRACNVAFGNGGVVDFGSIKAADLNSGQPTSLRMSRYMSLSVTCATATRFGVRVEDNRAGTHFSGGLFGESADMGRNVFGLGTASGKRIGEYTLALSFDFGDGQPVELLHAPDFALGAPWWQIGPGGIFMDNTGKSVTSFTEAGGTDPAAFSSISGDVNVVGFVNRSDELDLSQHIQIDGSTTLELVYL